MDRRLEQALAFESGDLLVEVDDLDTFERAALNLAVAVEAYGDGVSPPDDLDVLEQAMWDALDAFLATLPDAEERYDNTMRNMNVPGVYTADDPPIRVN